MMCIVHVPVRVRNRLVDMSVRVSFREMKPQAERHESARDHKCRRHSLVPHREADRSADERSKREVCSRSRCSQVAHGEYIKHTTQPVAQKADDQGTAQISEWWPARACRQADAKIYQTGHPSLYRRNLNRIFR